jgi:hypothetical protein
MILEFFVCFIFLIVLHILWVDFLLRFSWRLLYRILQSLPWSSFLVFLRFLIQFFSIFWCINLFIALYKSGLSDMSAQTHINRFTLIVKLLLGERLRALIWRISPSWAGRAIWVSTPTGRLIVSTRRVWAYWACTALASWHTSSKSNMLLFVIYSPSRSAKWIWTILKAELHLISIYRTWTC